MESTQDRPPPRLRPARVPPRTVLIALLFTGNVVMWADRLNIGVAAPALMAEMHWTPTVMGWVLSAFAFGYLVMQIPGGLLADAAPGSVLLWSVFATSAFTALTPAGLGATAMVVIRACLGLSQGPYLPAAATVVGRAVPIGQRGRTQALTQSASNLAPALFIPIAAWLVHRFGWRSAFYLFAAMGVVWLGAWRLASAPAGGAEAATERASSPPARPPGLSRTRMLGIGRSRTVWGVVLSYFAVPYITFMLLGWLPTLFATRFGLTLVHAGLVATIPFIVGFIAQIVSGSALDRLTAARWPRAAAHKLLIGVGYGGCAFFMLIAAASFEVRWVVVCLTLATAFLGLPAAPFWTLPIDLAPQQAGSLAGTMNFAGVAGAVLSPVLTGWLVSSTGRWETSFLASAFVAAACAAIAVATIEDRAFTTRHMRA